MDPPKFAFLVPLQPEVDLGDYKDIRVEYSPEEVSEDEVEDFLKKFTAKLCDCRTSGSTNSGWRFSLLQNYCN